MYRKLTELDVQYSTYAVVLPDKTRIYGVFMYGCVRLYLYVASFSSPSSHVFVFFSLYVTNLLLHSVDGTAINRKKLYVTRFPTLSFLTWMRLFSLLVQHLQYTFWHILCSVLGDNLLCDSDDYLHLPQLLSPYLLHLCLITISPGKVPWQRHNQVIDLPLLALFSQHG